MDKTIENKLFTEFECGYGAASLCLEYIKRMVVNDESPDFDDSILKFYQSIPERVAQRTASFDEIAWPINLAGEYRIAQEISDNLDKCSSENERNRYINSILQVFEEWAKIFSPMARLQMLEQVQQKSKIGLSQYTEKEVQNEIDRISGLHDQYLKVMHKAEKGTIEYYFDYWHRAYYKFCNMFAAICVEHNINLLELQNNRGIWLVRKLDVMELQFYFGYDYNFKYANTLLKALPRTSATEHLILTMRDGVINTEAAWNGNDDKWTLPNELDTDRARKYFSRAIEAKMIELTQDRGKSLTTTAQLGYICGKIYPQPRPLSALEKFFNVPKLSASITQSEYEAKRADVKRWRKNIDDTIFYD